GTAAPLPCLFGTTQKNRPSKLAQKAETLYLNLEDLIRRRGLERIGLVTLTFVENLTDRIEAQRRFNNLNTGFLEDEVEEYIAAIERQMRGALHYHLVCAFPYDIRSGFDFQTCSLANQAKREGRQEDFRRLQRQAFRTANPALREWWAKLREAAESYSFGRCETLPILSNSAALSRYVGAYVTSEWNNRKFWDKGMRTVRYALDHRVATCRWSWANDQGRVWRMGCKVLGTILQLQYERFTEVLGNRWAWNFKEDISAFGRHWELCLAAVMEIADDGASFSRRLARVSRLALVIEHFEEAEQQKEQHAK
ncbi:MAG: rolling circle replication-associated protein, partial [Limisphaerales bacterium]